VAEQQEATETLQDLQDLTADLAVAVAVVTQVALCLAEWVHKIKVIAVEL
jgi:hypothetical protein